MFISNAFSLQMVADDLPCNIKVEEIDTIKGLHLDSAIGHADTASVLGFDCNRINIKLQKGDSLIVAQLLGGRLPEGSKTLPDGFKFKFVKVTIE